MDSNSLPCSSMLSQMNCGHHASHSLHFNADCVLHVNALRSVSCNAFLSCFTSSKRMLNISFIEFLKLNVEKFEPLKKRFIMAYFVCDCPSTCHGFIHSSSALSSSHATIIVGLWSLDLPSSEFCGHTFKFCITRWDPLSHHN